MFGAYEMFLLTWLTHPGVVLNLFGGTPVMSALWQCMWMSILYYSITKESAAITMTTLYTVFAVVWTYYTARSAWGSMAAKAKSA